MEERPKSGLEALMAALGGSGFNVDGFGGTQNAKSAEDEIAEEVDSVFSGSNGEGTASGQQRKSGNGSGAMPKVHFIEDMAEWSKKRLVIAAIVAILALAAAYWWFHPPISTFPITIGADDTLIFTSLHLDILGGLIFY